MSTVCVLTPMVIGSWPAIASAVLGAAGAMGFSVAGVGTMNEHGRNSVETEVANSEVLAETLARGEKMVVERGGVRIELGVDDRGRCTVCASGDLSKLELRKIGEDLAGRVVQQFAYHKLMTELKSRGFEIEEESVKSDQSIQVRVKTR